MTLNFKTLPSFPSLPCRPTPPDVEAVAKGLARAAHASIDQRRKFTDEPYIVHPAKVAQMVAVHGGSREAIAASWCHDVVEDTPVPLEAIWEACGSAVAKLVWEVSDICTPNVGNRKERKVLELEHIRRGSAESHLIKWADALDNLPSLEQHSPQFACVWVDEKLDMAHVLQIDDTRKTHLLRTLGEAKTRLESLALNEWLLAHDAFNEKRRALVR
jgi:(p)ppGpp synthase/HD superfamily hydrolase